MRPTSAGLTIVELLIATVIFGLVLAGIGSFLIGGIQFTASATSTAERLREVNDAAGYLSDNIRRSAYIASGTGSNCGGDATVVSCVSLVVPVTAANAPSVESYDGVHLHLVRRGSVPSPQRVEDPWADANTWAIVEYRKATLVPCNPPTPCPAPPAPAKVDGTWSGPFLVVDHVSDQSLLEVDGASVRLALQVASHRRGTVSLTPTVPQEILVVPRNTSP